MNLPALHHMVRVRTSDDLTFVSAGLMDEILINANQLENSAQSTATCLTRTGLPFSVDPVLWRFQVPAWWRTAAGATKRNYRRLAEAYTKGTTVDLPGGPLLEVVTNDDDWRRLAANVVEYQRQRLLIAPAQLDLLAAPGGDLRPARVVAPALVPYSSDVDAINRILVEASVDASREPVAAQVIVPPDRLLDDREREHLLAELPIEGISSYLVWTPQITEELLLANHAAFAALFALTAKLVERGIPVGHQYANYSIAALHDIGLAAVAHHLGWVDKGEPAEEQRFTLRSRQTYAPGVRHTIRFHRAGELAGDLDAADYIDQYCACTFCSGAFDTGRHPFELLLQDQVVTFSNGREYRTPTAQAVAANNWHYLLSRRLEIAAFSAEPAAQVIERDMQRAARLAGGGGSERLRRLAAELRSA